MPVPVRLGLLVDSDAFGGAEMYVRQLLRRLPPHFSRRLAARVERGRLRARAAVAALDEAAAGRTGGVSAPDPFRVTAIAGWAGSCDPGSEVSR